MVTKLDRLARSLPDARDIADELTIKGVALSLGGSVYDPNDPNDPVGRLLFNALGMVAEFEADLIRLRTREGMAIARSKGKLKGKKPKLSPSQRKHLMTLHTAGEHTQAELNWDSVRSRTCLCARLSDLPMSRANSRRGLRRVLGLTPRWCPNVGKSSPDQAAVHLA